MAFGRCKLGTLVQWITGFCNLMKHKWRKTPNVDPACRRCGLEEETPIHLSLDCMALATARVNAMFQWQNETHEWKTKELHNFIVHSNSKELLVDEEDYNWNPEW